MRGKGKWIAGTILLLAVVVGRYLYQRDQNARYPLDFDLNQVETVTLSNIAATLTLTDLGEEGREIDMNVYDVAGGAMPVTEERFSESDFVIGPVSNTDIARTINASKGAIREAHALPRHQAIR